MDNKDLETQRGGSAPGAGISSKSGTGMAAVAYSIDFESTTCYGRAQGRCIGGGSWHCDGPMSTYHPEEAYNSMLENVGPGHGDMYCVGSDSYD